MNAAADGSPLLTFSNLRKSIGGQRLLDIERFSIQRGTCTLLSGKNGAGKTTLLKIIAGLEPPDRAHVCYQGCTLPWRKAQRRYRHEVVYLHQYPYLFDCSVSDNIAYGLKRAGMARAEIAPKVSEALDWAGLSHLAARNAHELSGGEKQRVALTRAWVLSPRILLLDEPVASMDQESREHTFFLIRRLKSEGVALVITSHELRPVLPLGDIHLRLADGRLLPETMASGPAPRSVRDSTVLLDNRIYPQGLA